MVTLWSAYSLQAVTNIKVNGGITPFGDVPTFEISPGGPYTI